jgi:hypothetical protein
MATIPRNELSSLGTGSVLQAQKVFVPRNVLDYLSLKQGNEVEYLQILDSNYRNTVMIRKK